MALPVPRGRETREIRLGSSRDSLLFCVLILWVYISPLLVGGWN